MFNTLGYTGGNSWFSDGNNSPEQCEKGRKDGIKPTREWRKWLRIT